MKNRLRYPLGFGLCMFLLLVLAPGFSAAAGKATDPGVRPPKVTPEAERPCARWITDATPIPDAAWVKDLPEAQQKLFCAGAVKFATVDGLHEGLGPTFNFNSCKGCHDFPSTGGSSPGPYPGDGGANTNPQYAFASTQYQAGTNSIPWFVQARGPVREVRFVHADKGKPDGGVHAVFTIRGLEGNTQCSLDQPDFDAQHRKGNMIFRIPTPTFGAGLLEQIEDSTIDANLKSRQARRYGMAKNTRGFSLPIGRLNIVRVGHAHGSENRNGNDGTIARFGWKAQNKSLLVFAGEAYNVEMGISNELFQTERDETPACQFAPVPNDTSNPDRSGLAVLSDVELFAAFMRYLAPPARDAEYPHGASSGAQGEVIFDRIGCSHCHSPSMQTSMQSAVSALRDHDVALYSDLALHHMGYGLADGISQGQAGGDEFRSAPLWGLGQRAFFLHDGRTGDLVEAIRAHASPKGHGYPKSEANPVVSEYFRLSNEDQQHLLDFLRSL
ncbi:MAG: thiol oxidoreductase [Pseudomonadota bacterium]|nr:thiol oxidoreductase [Pseudomonadota bacterium]